MESVEQQTKKKLCLLTKTKDKNKGKKKKRFFKVGIDVKKKNMGTPIFFFSGAGGIHLFSSFLAFLFSFCFLGFYFLECPSPPFFELSPFKIKQHVMHEKGWVGGWSCVHERNR